MRFLLAIISSLLAALSLIGLVVVARFVGPVIEARYFPVLKNQQPYVTRTGNSVILEISMLKARDCSIDSIVWQIARSDVKEKVVSRAPISVSRVEGATDPRVVYPPGYLRNGPFKAILPESYALANEILGQIEYRCHPFWTTPQIYGPFPIPPGKP